MLLSLENSTSIPIPFLIRRLSVIALCVDEISSMPDPAPNTVFLEMALLFDCSIWIPLEYSIVLFVTVEFMVLSSQIPCPLDVRVRF